MFKPFMVVGVVCGVVACKDNDKVVECGSSGVAGGAGCGDRLVCICVWIK